MESLKERVKTKKLWGGVTLVAFGIAGLCGVEPWMAVSVLAIAWGVMGICWQGWQQKVEEHHHHHHHNNNKKQSTNKKSGPMKKNYKKT
jgi:hypothetical protein